MQTRISQRSTHTAIARATALAAIAAVAADLLVYSLAHALWGVPGGFSFFNPVSIIVVAVGAVVVAAAGLSVLTSLTRHAVTIFVVVAVGMTLLSLAMPLQAMAGLMPGVPAASTATGVTMVVLHLLTGGAAVGLLPILARPAV